jgi:hypothetical protein
VAWGRLPDPLGDQGYGVVVINVDDDDQPPYAERFVTHTTLQILAADPAPPMIFVAHSGAGPLLPTITTSLTNAQRPASSGYIFLDAGLPRPGQPSRLDMLYEEDDGLAAGFLDSLRAGATFPVWTVDDLADIVPTGDRLTLIASLRPRALDFFTEPLPALEGWPDAPCGYLRTSAAYDFWLRIAEAQGWPVVRRDLGHFPALANPEGTLLALVELTGRL